MAYTGTRVKIPLGEMGLLTDISPDKIPPSALIRAENVCFFNGNVQKAPGTLRWNATAVSAGIIAAHYFLPTLEKPRFIVATSDGNLYKGRDRVFGSPINSTITNTLTPNCVFAEGGAETAGREKKLFFFTGGATQPYVLAGDGAAFRTISAPSTDWSTSETFPKFGIVHRNQLWAFAGQISYASDSGNHEDFQNTTTTLTEPVYPGEGGELRGGYVYKGRLVCFKDGGFVYMLNDTATDPGDWYWQKIASNFGLAAPNAVVEVLDDMIAGNTYGTLTSYAATQKLGNIEAADIIQQLMFESFLRGNSSKVGVPFQHVIYYAEKKLLLMTYRSAYYTYNDMLIAFDYGRAQTRPALWKKGSPQCLALYKDINQVERPMYGDKDGYLHLMDQEDRVEGQCIQAVTARQVIVASPVLTSGSYVLNFNGQSTAALPWNAAAIDIQIALSAFTGLADVSTNGALDAGAATVNVAFFGWDGPADLITVTSNTTGSTFTITTIAVGVAGSSASPVAYTGAFQIPHLDFSHVDQSLSAVQKHFDFLAVHYVPESTGNLSCDYFIDGRYIETLTFPMVQYNKPELDVFLLSTARLAQPNTETVIRQLHGTGRTFSAYFYQSGSNESFQIPAITVYFRGGGDKAQETGGDT